jgi:hypothetical protein
VPDLRSRPRCWPATLTLTLQLATVDRDGFDPNPALTLTPQLATVDRDGFDPNPALTLTPQLATVDRDGFENRAVVFGAGIEGGVPTFNAALLPAGPATVCWWLLMDPDYLDKLHHALSGETGGTHDSDDSDDSDGSGVTDGDPDDTYIPMAASLARTVGPPPVNCKDPFDVAVELQGPY